MIHFSGVVQLAAINKEDITKNNDKVVYFTAFARRGEQSDRLFFKVYGKTAEYLMRNLVKKEDGKYKSRKISVAGRLETYESSKSETLPPKELRPEHIPPQFGMIKEPLAISFTREVKETTFCFVCSYLEFEDKKKETETIEIYRSNGENSYTPQSNTNDTYIKETGSLASKINNATQNINGINEPDLKGII